MLIGIDHIDVGKCCQCGCEFALTGEQFHSLPSGPSGAVRCPRCGKDAAEPIVGVCPHCKKSVRQSDLAKVSGAYEKGFCPFCLKSIFSKPADPAKEK